MWGPNTDITTKNIKLFSKTINALRAFFLNKGYIEVHTQNRLSIMATCEDPFTLTTYDYSGQTWPLPQTGQMWLEYELLTNPDVPGVFCVSTSYRQEPNPIPGRHDMIFPMFEFESKGSMDDLRKMETELCEHMGYGKRDSFVYKQYDELAKYYGVKELTAEHETKMHEEFGDVVFLERFPNYTSPFWNMKKDSDHSKKIDVIIHGIESIGSAERSTNPDEMREMFYTISDGGYAKALFSRFGKERVEKEFEEYLKLNFFPRFGAGIGVGRMMRPFAKKEQTN